MVFSQKDMALLETISRMLRQQNYSDIYASMKRDEFDQLVKKIKSEGKS